ncbi:MAG: cupin domain-containing protein [Spirochaetaceae bacterium]|nr:cupin domain-containing protein [Spirochaetaceae bacterium]
MEIQNEVPYLVNERDVEWEPHPAGIPGVAMKKLRSRDTGDHQESIAMVRVQTNSVVPPHVHEREDDNLYVLSGRARMRVGSAVFEIGPGAQITAPANVEHEIFDIVEDLYIYDVFAPRTF